MYCSKTDIQGYGSEFEIPSGWTDDNINSLIVDIQEDVNSWLNDDFTGLQTLTLTMDGTGNGILFTRPYTKMPLVSVTSLVWRESTLSSFDASLNAWATYDYYASTYYIEATGKDYDGSVRYFTKGKFIKGIKNYQLIGVFGYATVPAYVKQITVLLCRERIKAGYLSSLDVNSVAWSDYKVTYASTKKDIPVYSGYPTVDAIIHRKINRSTFLMKV